MIIISYFPVPQIWAEIIQLPVKIMRIYCGAVINMWAELIEFGFHGIEVAVYICVCILDHILWTCIIRQEKLILKISYSLQ